MFAPATSAASGVNSFGLWLMPPTLGTKIIAVGCDAGDHLGIVPGAGRHAFRSEAAIARGLLDESYDALIELDRLKAGQALHGDGHVLFVRQAVEVGGQSRFLLLEAVFVGVAKVDGEGGAGGNDVDRVGLEANRADRRHSARFRCLGAIAQKGIHAGCRQAGVTAHRDRRRAGMVRLAVNRHLFARKCLAGFRPPRWRCSPARGPVPVRCAVRDRRGV
jgi:hypothetical protein